MFNDHPHPNARIPWEAQALSFWVALVTFCVFAAARHFGFLQWDDAANFLKNTHYQSFSAASLRWMWTTHYRGPYQPLSWLSIALDNRLWGLSAPAWHRTNLILHSANALLFYWVSWELLSIGGIKDRSARAFLAAFAALFFAIHPLRVESVVWITERRDVLSGFFFLTAVLAYLYDARGFGTGTYYWIALVSFLLALLSKGTAIGFIWVVLAIDFYLGRTDWRSKIPFLLAAVAAGLANAVGFQTRDLAVGHYGVIDRLVLFLHSVGFYFEKTFLPIHLSPYYELPKHLRGVAAVLFWRSALALIVTAAAWRLRRRWIALWLGWCCYVLILAPVSGLAQNGQQLTADRYSYLSCLPLAILAAGGLALLWKRSVNAAGALAACVIVVLGGLTVRQVSYWHDDFALWRQALQFSRKSCLVHFNLGLEWQKAGVFNQAVEEFTQSALLCPEDVESYMNRALAYDALGQPAAAEADYRAAAALEPSSPEPQNNLALLLFKEGRWDDATAILEQLIQTHPDFPEARFNLGILKAAHHDWSGARADVRHAVQMNPALLERLPPPVKKRLALP